MGWLLVGHVIHDTKAMFFLDFLKNDPRTRTPKLASVLRASVLHHGLRNLFVKASDKRNRFRREASWMISLFSTSMQNWRR
jgi:hypothetical protein